MAAGTTEVTEMPKVRRLARVIADRGDPRDPERLQHLGGSEIAALGLAAPQREVRLVGISPASCNA
jgi:hypothetical protein